MVTQNAYMQHATAAAAASNAKISNENNSSGMRTPTTSTDPDMPYNSQSPSASPSSSSSPTPSTAAALRFEDLTIDDELNTLDRVIRYCRSGIALQRLVHVKMLSEVVQTHGTEAAINHITPLLPTLVTDPESIIRQHLATQLLPLSTLCLSSTPTPKNPYPSPLRGYKLVTDVILPHLTKLLSDPDQDVRKASSDAIGGLAALIQPTDVNRLILPIPLRLSQDNRPQIEGEDLRVTAAALLGELSPSLGPELVPQFVTPTLLSLGHDNAFRVRKSAAQAIPHVVSATTVRDAEMRLLPVFRQLVRDEMYRVRKTCAECMVDMSRGMVALKAPEEEVLELRRRELIPMVVGLLEDANKLVRFGMMQFLGPFIASFFPLGDAGGGGGKGGGIEGVAYFPHSLVHPGDDLKSVVGEGSGEGGGGGGNLPQHSKAEHDVNSEKHPLSPLHHNLSPFINQILSHRSSHPPHPSDLKSISTSLLPHFSSLSTISTADPTIDAEMRVHCAYSLPAALLLLGHTSWTPTLKTTFLTLCVADPPAVKRCLASSLHVLAHILPPEVVESDILPLLENTFLRSTDEITKTNTFKHMSSLLDTLTFKKRSDLLPVLTDIVLNSSQKKNDAPNQLNWRLRHVVAKQLPDFLTLFAPDDVRRHVTKFLFAFLGDNVALVREESYAAIPILFNVYRDQEWGREGCREIIGFLKGSVGEFSQRMGYCRICAAMGVAIVMEREGRGGDTRFLEACLGEMLPLALKMKDDRVANVRANLRKCLMSMERCWEGNGKKSFLSSSMAGTVRDVMRDLEEEAVTWEFTGGWEKDPVGLRARVVNGRGSVREGKDKGYVRGNKGVGKENCNNEEDSDESASLASI